MLYKFYYTNGKSRVISFYSEEAFKVIAQKERDGISYIVRLDGTSEVLYP